MWASLIELLVVVSLGSVAESVCGRRDLRDYCADLSESMANNMAVYTSAQVAFNEAMTHLRSIRNIGVGSRHRLARAWEAVIKENAECGPESADYVWTIIDCAPEHNDEMVTLDKAVRTYAIKCLVSSFWDEQLEKTLGNEDKTGLLRFLTNNYIEEYLADNPDDPKINLGEVRGMRCCNPGRNLGVLLQALQLLAGPSGPGQLMETNVDELERLMDTHLIKPCGKYLDLVGSLMKRAKDVAEYHPQGPEVFMKNLSVNFRYAIFRYKYCNAFRFIINEE